MIDLRALDELSATSSGSLKDILSHVENPYCFRVGETPVRISFKDSEKPLEEKLKAYFLGLKMG